MFVYSLLNFDDCEHSIEDITKKWDAAYFVGRVKFDDVVWNEGMIYIDSIRDSKHVQGTIFLEQNLEKKHFNCPLSNIFIVKEFPKTGVFKVGTLFGDYVCRLTRSNERQWRRGCNGATVLVDYLYKPDSSLVEHKLKRQGHKPDIEDIYYAAFYNKPQPIEQALQNCKQNFPQVINYKYWLKYRDEMFYDLYYYDLFIGMVTPNKECIFHSETETLADEAKNVFGLQKI